MNLISNLADWDELAPRWRALVARAQPPAAPFLVPEFARAWWSVFGAEDGAEIHILPIETGEVADSRLVGVIPLARSGPAAAWLGDHEVADYMGPVAASGHEQHLVNALFDHLERSGLSQLDLRGLDADSTLLDRLLQTSRRRGWLANLSDEAVCPVVDLHEGWNAYLERLRPRDRREVRRKLRPLRQLPSTVDFDVLSSPADIAAQLPALLEMMRGSRVDKAEFLTAPMERFFTALGEAMSVHGWLRLYRLNISAVAAAMVLCWETPEELMLYNSGFDPRFRDLNVGLASKVLCLRDAAARGLQRVNFLRGDEPYKFELGGRACIIRRLQLQRMD